MEEVLTPPRYISDVGAQYLKPLFIAMSAVTVVTLDLTLLFERWLRHTGRLSHNTSLFQKILSLISIIASIVGAAGLILLTIFDTLRHPRLHDVFLALFMYVAHCHVYEPYVNGVLQRWLPCVCYLHLLGISAPRYSLPPTPTLARLLLDEACLHHCRTCPCHR